MKVFNRRVKIAHLPQKLISFSAMLVSAAKLFRSPYRLIQAYLTLSMPQDNQYSLKNGKSLFLSSNPHDSVTVMVIFCRKEYGKIPKDAVVLDIGANIGMFSMYAAFSGAKKVFAFEPNPEAFKVLCQNIEENDLENIVHPFHLGVSDQDEKMIYMPMASSPYNKATTAHTADNMHPIKTLSLSTILKNIICQSVDLCKIDCEGAEYEILYNTSTDCFNQIDAIRMEHHRAEEKEKLLDYLENNDYQLVHEQNMILWLKNSKYSIYEK